MEFLSLKVTAGGVAPLPDQLAAVRDFPHPNTVKELQAFLGAVNFYRHFIPAAAKILLPLTCVTPLLHMWGQFSNRRPVQVLIGGR